MSKSILPYIIIALLIGLMVYFYMEKQNRKIQVLTTDLGDVQSHLAQNQFVLQVALQQTQEIGQMIKRFNTVPFQPNEKREPIGFKTKNNE